MSRYPLLPRFIIGGATAAGTSFLSSILSQHPDIYLPSEGEPHFFSLTHRYLRGLEWYKQCFKPTIEKQVIGDHSSSYFHFPKAAKRIKSLIPDMKLIFLLRNPVDRAWAQYRYMVFRGIETLPFEEAIEKEKERRQGELNQKIQLRHHDYIYRSHYGLHLKQYSRVFSFDQLLFIDSRKLKIDLKSQLRKITDFLSIQPNFSFCLPPDFPTMSVKNAMIQYEFRQYFGAKKSRVILEKIRHGLNDFSTEINSDTDKFQLNRVVKNILPFKEEIPLKIKKKLENKFSHDQKIFFELAGHFIDFKPWI